MLGGTRINRMLPKAFVCLCALCALVGCGSPSVNLRPQRIACLGDSITRGDSAGVGQSYPEQLGRMLGAGWEVRNYGVNGATLSRQGDVPYAEQEEVTAAIAWQPDVVVLLLGANDSKPQNWRGSGHFSLEFEHMLKRLKEIPSQPVILLCEPIPVFGDGNYSITPARVGEIRILLRELAGQRGCRIVDLFSPLENQPLLLRDLIHPNADGAEIIARQIANDIL